MYGIHLIEYKNKKWKEKLWHLEKADIAIDDAKKNSIFLRRKTSIY
jgi:hypothetical protein